LRRERASVRASFLAPGLVPGLAAGARLAAGLEAGLDAGLVVGLDAGLAEEDFAAGLPLATCPLCRLRAAAGLALCKLLAPFAWEPFCLLWPFVCPFPFPVPCPFFAAPCDQRAGVAWREFPLEFAPLLRDVLRATRPCVELDAGLRFRA
jgi:hypothetical protein